MHEGSVVEDSWKEAVGLHGSLEPPSTPVGNVSYAGHFTSVTSNTVHRQHEVKGATHDNKALHIFCFHVALAMQGSSPVQVNFPLSVPSLLHCNVDDAPLPPFCS